MPQNKDGILNVYIWNGLAFWRKMTFPIAFSQKYKKWGFTTRQLIVQTKNLRQNIFFKKYENFVEWLFRSFTSWQRGRDVAAKKTLPYFDRGSVAATPTKICF